jgi:hypothetical protein
MASIINSSTTSGLAATGDTSDELKLQTGGTDAVTVSSGQVCSFANNFGTVANLPAYQCRAWVNFNGTGTVAIRASGNVTSITDNGTGDYTVNFTTAMPDANYSANVTTQTGGIASATTYDGATARTTTALRVAALTTAGSFVDSAQMGVSIFR